jgi:UDP-GlcNAc:undecaprenyl-phosphate GlcNAc-1-phosphate transferase
VPRLGGVSVVLSTFVMVALLLVWDNQVADRIVQNFQLAVSLAGAAGAVFLVGLYDDLRGARPCQKLLVQCGAGAALFVAGFRVDVLTNPFTHSPIHLGALALPVTLLWLVAISNAFNLIDGLDGLAAGVGLTSTLAVFFLASVQSHSLAAVVAVAMAGGLVGFLPHNFNPAKIYLGDSGSLTIGLVLAALAVETSQKGPVLIALSIPLMIFGLPLLDVSVTTFRRFLSGHPIFSRDEEHLHHRLVKAGFTPRASVLILYGVAALFALASLLIVNYKGAFAPVVALMCGLLAWLLVRQMQYPEFAALDTHVRGEWRSQKAVFRSQILFRKEANVLASAGSLAEAWETAARVLTALEFESATLEFSPSIGNGALHWTEPAQAAGPAADTTPRWTLTVPLANGDVPVGTLRLTYAMNRGTLKFRIVNTIEFFSGPFAEAIARLTIEESTGRSNAAAASP